MNYVASRPTWRGSSRIASLEDFIRKPRARAKSKLSQEVQINEEEGGGTEGEDATTESISRPSSSNTYDTSLGNSDAEEHHENTTSWTTPTSPKAITPKEPEHQLQATAVSPIVARFQAFPGHKESKAPTCTLGNTIFDIPTFLEPHDSMISILCAYLTEGYSELDGPSNITISPHIKRQALRDLHALMIGREPRTYEAKGQVISIYSCSGRRPRLMCAAIEVVHAPLGFPNQEVWLWEPLEVTKVERLADGSLVVFRIVWQMEDNHWEVVDVGQ